MSRYLIDTNVISEIRKANADVGVVRFMSSQDAKDLFLSVLTLGELRKGVEAKRRTDPITAERLGIWVEGIEAQYSPRLIPVDSTIAKLWGELSAGRSLPPVDTLLAATAIVHGLIFVTRNTRDVELTGVATLNPWNSQ